MTSDKVEAALLAMIAHSRRVIQLADQIIARTAPDAPAALVVDMKLSLCKLTNAPETLTDLRAIAIKEREQAQRDIENAELQISTRRNYAAICGEK